MNVNEVKRFLETTKTAAHWRRIGVRPHHGVCVPLFSLRTKRSLGMGEFCDLIPLILWCKEVGFTCIQLLPLNDTADDPSPYNPISSCALNPLYLSLRELPGKLPDFSELDVLNHAPHIDFQVRSVKRRWLAQYVEQNIEDQKEASLYQEFISSHAWLIPYANHREQQTGMSARHHIFLQFHAFRQMAQVYAVAKEQHILILSDLSFGMSLQSVDCVEYPQFFDFAHTIGAPPDYYNPAGQSWGFPAFNWEAMRDSHLVWWKRRLQVLGYYSDAYRIDHVVGLFRCWTLSMQGEGTFVPSDPDLWGRHGQEMLEGLIAFSPLLPLGEDLGTIPLVTYEVLHKLGICGTKVMRWESEDPKNYDAISLTTVSTADSSLLAMWQEESGNARERLDLLRAAHQSASLFHINLLPEYLAICPEWVESPEEERINVPGMIYERNWNYRMKPWLEEVVCSQKLKEAVRYCLV